MGDETKPLPALQGSAGLTQLMKWEEMPLSSLLAVLTRWFECDEFELSVSNRPDVATRMWFTLRFKLPEWYGHESKRVRYLSASSLELTKARLIKCLDREQLSKIRLDWKRETAEKEAADSSAVSE